MNVAEAPRDSGFATVTFPAPVATDICDSSPLVFSTPPSGSVLPVGTNTITCTAADSSGNSNSCTFTIRVIPYRLHVIVSSLADSGPGTLRQAILDANDSPDENLVVFNFPGSAPYTIHLLSALPAITSPIIIDGWSQPGFSGTPVVEVDGSTANNSIDGLVIQSGPSTVRGLALHGFATAIRLTTAGTNVIQGNYIGTDTSGTNALGNTSGIYVSSQKNLIGGTAPNAGNVISGNTGNGILFDTLTATRNAVQDNLIGVAAGGFSPLDNGLNGIYFTNQPSRNLVGATTNGAANTIAFNGRNGISLAPSAGTGNQFLGNIIVSNVALGIDLGDDGVTPNDSDDSDTGPNGLQNFPVLTDATSVSGVLTVFGQITSAANTTFRIDFFLNDLDDPSGYGEAQVFLGSAFVGMHGNGTGSFTVPFTVFATFTQFVTVTATGPHGTSEFSAAVQVRTPPSITVQPASTNAPIGSSASFCAQAVGTPPFLYQWRLNGFNIQGAPNACYTVPAAGRTNGGHAAEGVAHHRR